MNRVALGHWPTPLEPAPALSEYLGLRAGDLWVKRDDLTALVGGNKVRKLEHTVGAALAEGADVLVTTGAEQSNHARATAAAAARLGLGCVLVLGGTPPATPTGNALLDRLFGAELVWTDDLERTAGQVVERLRDAGRRPYRVPFGGSGPVGALGYREAADELLAQRPDLAHVVVAVGSGGTMAGLVAGLGAGRVLGVDVGAVPDAAERVAGMVAALGAPADGLRLRTDQVGEGYGRPTDEARRSIHAAARLAGLVLDPVYTAKAFAGLYASVADGGIRPGEPTVFLHSGGLPGFFAAPEAALSAPPPRD
jgi:L-cysteate sulfo-lyase